MEAAVAAVDISAVAAVHISAVAAVRISAVAAVHISAVAAAHISAVAAVHISAGAAIAAVTDDMEDMDTAADMDTGYTLTTGMDMTTDTTRAGNGLAGRTRTTFTSAIEARKAKTRYGRGSHRHLGGREMVNLATP
jgi:hypothetical protein